MLLGAIKMVFSVFAWTNDRSWNDAVNSRNRIVSHYSGHVSFWLSFGRARTDDKSLFRLLEFRCLELLPFEDTELTDVLRRASVP